MSCTIHDVCLGDCANRDRPTCSHISRDLTGRCFACGHVDEAALADAREAGRTAADPWHRHVVCDACGNPVQVAAHGSRRVLPCPFCREIRRRTALARARTLSTGADLDGKNSIEAALLAYRNAVSDWEHSDPISGEGKDAAARQCAAYLDVLAATDEAETAAFIRGREVVRKYPDGWGLRLPLTQAAAEQLVSAFYDEMNTWHPDGHGRPARAAILAALTGKGLS